MSFKKYFSKYLSVSLSVAYVVSGGSTSLYRSDAAIAADPGTPYGISVQQDSVFYACETAPVEGSETLSTFAQAALARAERNLAQIENAAKRGDALYRLGAGYACTGQVQKAEVALSEAVVVASDIEDAAYQGTLLLAIARTYKRPLNDLAQMESLLSQILSLVDAMPESAKNNGSNYPYYLLQNIAHLYAEIGEYEKLRTVLDRVETQENRLWMLQSVAELLDNVATEADRERLSQLFADDFEALENSPMFNGGVEQSDPILAYLIELNVLQGFENSDNPSALLDELLPKQLELIEALPDDGSQAIAYGSLGRVILLGNQPERALPFLQKAAIAFSDLDRLLATAESSEDFADTLLTQVSLNTGLSLMQAGEVEQGRALVSQVLRAPVRAEETASVLISILPTFEEIAIDERIELLGEAEKLLAMIAQESNRTETQVLLANAYVHVGQPEAARRLLQPLLTTLANNPQSEIDERGLGALPALLVTLGDYEQSIALAKRFSDESQQVLLLNDLLRAGQDDLALTTLNGMENASSQIVGLSTLISVYYEQDRLDPAVELAERALQLIQSPMLTAVSYYGDDTDYSEQELNYYMDLLRVDFTTQALFPFSEPVRFRLADADEALATAQSEDDRLQSLIAQIEDSTLRVGLLINTFENTIVLDELGSDLNEIVALQLEDHVLLQLVKMAERNGQLTQALVFTEAMRSPYGQVVGLSYLVSRVSPDSVTSEAMDEAMERLQQL